MIFDDDRDEPVPDPIRSRDDFRHEATGWALPKDLAAALSRSPRARRTFDGLTDRDQRDHVQRLQNVRDTGDRERFLDGMLAMLEKGRDFPG